MYWDEDAERWSEEGCWLSAAEAAAVECSCTHLSLFAAVWVSFVHTVICTNFKARRARVTTSVRVAPETLRNRRFP